MTGAVRGSVATPLAATTASVLRAVGWGQMARPVTVRWTTACSWTDCGIPSAQLGFPGLLE